MNVVMRCPRCKARREITYEKYLELCMPLSEKRLFCQNVMCDDVVMLFHKDAPKIVVQGEEVL